VALENLTQFSERCWGYRFELEWVSRKYLTPTRLKILNEKSAVFPYDSKRWRIRLLFEYLRFSPSYWRVHLAHTQKLPPRKVAAQRKLVEQVYELMGDVYSEPFTKWFRSRDQRVFWLGMTPSVQTLDSFLSAQQRLNDPDYGNQSLAREVAELVTERGDFAALVLLVPITRSIASNMRLVRQQLKPAHERIGPRALVRVERQSYSKYRLLRNKQRFGFLFQNLWFAAYCANRLSQEPVPQWKLGGEFGMLPNQYRDAQLNQDTYACNVLSAAVNRRLRHTLLVAENAARGSFPCSDVQPGFAEWDWESGGLAHRISEFA
jgi:hypothetical protein